MLLALDLAGVFAFALNGALTALLILDLVGTFAFAVNGALTALRATRLDIVGVITLGMITALGGGILRDVLLGALPPATFSDWRYLAVAAGGGLIAFAASRQLERLAMPITVLDALGLTSEDRAAVYERNARRVYPRLDAALRARDRL